MSIIAKILTLPFLLIRKILIGGSSIILVPVALFLLAWIQRSERREGNHIFEEYLGR